MQQISDDSMSFKHGKMGRLNIIPAPMKADSYSQ